MTLFVPQTLDTETFEDLFARTREPLFAYAATLLLDRAGAEDVVQRTFVVALTRRDAFRPGVGSAEAWLYGIARNIALDERRRVRRREAVESSCEPFENGVPDPRLEMATGEGSMFAAVRTLDPSDRELIALRFWADLSYAEIAALLHCSESNVGTRLHRALIKLREVCGDRI